MPPPPPPPHLNYVVQLKLRPVVLMRAAFIGLFLLVPRQIVGKNL
jgi:hypothetical protein